MFTIAGSDLFSVSLRQNLNLLLIISIYLIFSSLEMQRELLQTKVYYKLLDSSE